MTHVIFYDSTGRICLQMQGTSEVIDQTVELHPEWSFIFGMTDADTHYIVEGQLVPMPKRPSRYHQFGWQSKQWTLSAEALEQARGETITAINTQAGSIILETVPLWKQNNLTAQAIELQAIGRDNWTELEQEEWITSQKTWKWIKSIRIASNQATAAILQAETIEVMFEVRDTWSRSL